MAPRLLAVLAAAALCGGAAGDGDLYAALGLPRGADSAAVKKAYRKLAKQYHPDHNKEEGARERYHDIQEAYNVLNDEEKKRIYDEWGVRDEKELQRKQEARARAFGGGFFHSHGGFYHRPNPIQSDTPVLDAHSWRYNVAADDIYMVWYYSDRSGDCRRFAPDWDELAKAFDGIAKFARINYDSDRQLVVAQGASILPGIALYYRGAFHHMDSGVDMATLTATQVTSFFLEHHYHDIDWVTAANRDAFLAGYAHIPKVIYVLRAREHHVGGIPLELIRLQMVFAGRLKFGIADNAEAEVRQAFNVAQWGATTVVVRDGGRTVDTKSGGLRPAASVVKWLQDRQDHTVQKLTPLHRALCDGSGAAVTCGLIAFGSAVPADSKDAYIQAFEAMQTPPGVRRVWVHAAAQPQLLQEFGVFSVPAGGVAVVSFAPKDASQGAKTAAYTDVHAFATGAAPLLKEMYVKVSSTAAMRNGRSRLVVDAYTLAVVADGEEEPGVWFGIPYRALWTGAKHQVIGLPWQMIMFALSVLYLYYRDDGPADTNAAHHSNDGRDAASRRRYAQPQSQSAARPSTSTPTAATTPVRPQPPQPHRIQPIRSSHLTTAGKWSLVFLVPDTTALKSIDLPQSLLFDPAVMLSYVPEGSDASAPWYDLFNVPPGAVSIVAVRGVRKKWCMLWDGTRHKRAPTAEQLASAFDNVMNGTADIKLVLEWPTRTN